MYRTAVIALLMVFAGLQYRLWIADGGWSEIHRLQTVKQRLHRHNADEQTRNAAMQAEVDELKAGENATEGRARADMGMIKNDERFFLTVAPRNRDIRQASR